MRFSVVTSLLVIFGLTTAVPVAAYVASSSSYRLEKDSINFAGARSTSSSYIMEDTVGEISTGTSTSNSYNIHAGYQAMESDGVSVTILLSSPANVTMSPTIDGSSGGESDGSVAWTVTTNNTNGYSLSIRAAGSPALTASSGSFSDYTPAGAAPDFAFDVTSTAAEFGFSPEGSHITSTYKDNGSTCNTGASDTTGACWDGLDTTGKTIASSGSANNPGGTATTVKLKAKAGSAASVSAGSYSAIITATAITL